MEAFGHRTKKVRRQLARVVQPTSTAEQRLAQYELDAGQGHPVQELHPAVPRLDEHRRIVLIKVVQAHAPEGAALILAAENEDTAALVMHEHLGGRQQGILVADQVEPRAQERVDLTQRGWQGAAERRLGMVDMQFLHVRALPEEYWTAE
ncbi:hypothetical protein OHT93_36620 [Streptomyces sp. NBC_00191]|uniref:hypothetical protein n=1 Tax=Streptomyces sp. NBC_00191 TaxID=2975674 RepID=UPI003246E34C